MLRVQCIASRFIHVYLALYCVPAILLGTLPGPSKLAEAYEKPWRLVIPWVGKHVLHLSRDITALYAGDTTYEYVQTLCYAVLAVGAVCAWTILDSRVKHPASANWLRVCIRAALVFTLIGYGASKLVRQQFPFPPLERMLTTFGESSPRGLLWSFMGYSYGYSAFAGALEMLAALLLCFDRTVTAGLILAFGVLSNVAMLNLNYDVQLKLFSFHLVLITAVLIAPDLRRLTDFFSIARLHRTKPIPQSCRADCECPSRF